MTDQSLGYSKRTILAITRAFCNARRWSASLMALWSRRDRIVALSSLFTALTHCKSCSIDTWGVVLGGCFPPVLIDTVLKLKDGKVADFEGKGFVEEDGLADC
jgi:hypothetical protein